jgi:hypothetical protein
MSLDASIGIEQRFQRNTYIVIVIALLVSLFWVGHRMALGVLVGGALSLFNKRWLEGSVRGILSHAVIMQNGRVPPFTASKLILRYFVIALVIGLALWSGKVDLLGVAVGFAAFVCGVMIEAGYQLYLSLKTTGASSDTADEQTENLSKE